MSKVIITPNDLRKIKELAKSNFINDAVKGLRDDEFAVKCYLDACVSILRSKKINIEFEYKHDKNWKVKD